MERILKAMLILEPGAMDNQKPVWVPDIRKLAGMPPAEFNRLILEMSLSGAVIRLKKCPYPAQLTKQEKAEMVFDGEHFYSWVIIRADAAERIAALADEQEPVEPLAETVPDNPMPVEPVAVQTDQPDRMPVNQIRHTEPVSKKRGGFRPGAGRKTGSHVVDEYLKRVPVNVRLPLWLKEWLKGHGMAGELITQALIEKHGLTPPA